MLSSRNCVRRRQRPPGAAFLYRAWCWAPTGTRCVSAGRGTGTGSTSTAPLPRRNASAPLPLEVHTLDRVPEVREVVVVVVLLGVRRRVPQLGPDLLGG